MRLLTACLIGLLATAVAAGDDKEKSNAEKLIGTWQLVKSDSEIPKDVRFVVEFAAEGKMTLRIEKKDGDEKPVVLKGKYKVDGNKIDYTLTTPDGGKKQEVLVIKKLTDDELITEDPDGIKEQFKRLKTEKKGDKKPVKD
jgi:uncharacterized protein (TIGR03066 family)